MRLRLHSTVNMGESRLLVTTLLTIHFSDCYERPAPGRPSLYGLDRGKFENRLIYDRYDALNSTLTYLLHYDALRYDIVEGLDRYYTMTSGLACTI